MTARIRTVTDHLLEAQALLDGPLSDGDNVIPKEQLERALGCIENALSAIHLVRAEITAGLDKF